MTYAWQFRIMEYGGIPAKPVKHSAESKYVVRQEVSKHLASIMTLTETLDCDFVPADVKHAVRTVMACHKFNQEV